MTRPRSKARQRVLSTIASFAVANQGLWDAVALSVVVVDAAGHIVLSNSLAKTWLPPGESISQWPMPGLRRPVVWHVRQGGDRECWLEAVRTQLHASGLEDGATLITLRDVTEDHRRVQRNELDALTFQPIVDRANEAIAVLDRDLRVTYVNQRVCDVLGFRIDELIGRIGIELYAEAQDARSAIDAAQLMWARLDSGAASRATLWMPCRDGSRRWMLASASALYDLDHNVNQCVLVLTELTQQKALLDELAPRAAASVASALTSAQIGIAQLDRVLDDLSLHDGLTDIPNRRLFEDRMAYALEGARRDGSGLGLLVLDLDGFKQVNDLYGHAAGDSVLREVASRLKGVVRESDTVARMGGDEFAVLVRSTAGLADATSTAERIRHAVRRPIAIDDQVVEVDTSIGIAMYPMHGTDLDSLYRHADSAMFEAKRERAGYLVSQQSLQQALPSEVVIARDLRLALQRDELQVMYQPEVDLQTSELVGVEALVRWEHPQRGLLLPEDFIPAAERTRVMGQLTRWLLTTVIRQVRQWCQQGNPTRVSVNVSVWDLHDTRLAEDVGELLRAWEVEPRLLRVEVTENVLLPDVARARDTLRRLERLGVTLSLDDIGTGYSTLSLLKDVPAHEIKIDQSLVREVASDPTTATIVRALIRLAHELQRVTVAEGIETSQTRAILATLGCDAGQGYLIGRPMTPRELAHWSYSRGTAGSAGLDDHGPGGKCA